MINITRGNILEDNSEALVNTVNTVGVMGKGVALLFKHQFPENFQKYVDACRLGNVQTGKMFVTETDSLFGPKWIINFPTKQHWRNPSKLIWIRDGIFDLNKIIQEKKIKSVAIPPLGCGNGGLKWNIVLPLIVNSLNNTQDVRITIYEPTN